MLGGREVAGRAAETLPQGSGVRGVGGKDGEWGRRVRGNPWGHGGGCAQGGGSGLRAPCASLQSSAAPSEGTSVTQPDASRALSWYL